MSNSLTYSLSDLPKDFDWQYYIDIHPDLQKAGISTERQAKYHYIIHGKKENRVYKPKTEDCIIANKIIKNNSGYHKQINTQKVVLFVQWYDDSETKMNRIKCLKNNIDNKYIDHIHIFSDTQNLQDLFSIIEGKYHISISFIEDRLSYKNWMEYANKHYAEYIKILANSDIYFDKSIDTIRYQEYNRHTMYAITRKDLSLTGEIHESKDFFSDSAPKTNPVYSHDCWIYKNELKLHDLNKMNLKLGYDNCDRLLKKFINQERINFINLYPQINAIHIDYREYKNHKAYDLNYNPNQTTIYNINEYINIDVLSSFHNKLECVALLLTGNEINDGQYMDWIQTIISSIERCPSNKFFTKQLDLCIFTKINQTNSVDINLLRTYFRNIKVIGLDIPPQYDFYNELNNLSDLKYGYKSGPNYSFFQTFKYLSIYNTTLFLECDCYLSDDWIERIYNYSRFIGSFWISGALYDGMNMFNLHDIANQHINGGVCLYATGCATLINFMKFCFNLLPEYVLNYMDHIPYDYLIYKIIEDYFDFDDHNREIWQFIKRHYISNNLIYNYSTKSKTDTQATVASLLNKHNYAILHKKKNNVGAVIDINDCANPPLDFDYQFYFDTYPGTQNYYLIPDMDIVYSDRQRAYHHYVLYGKKLGYFKNIIEQKKQENKPVEIARYASKILRDY